MASLVVVIGPIASGKSSVATALADGLTARGSSVALVDIDDVVFMSRAPLDSVDELWARGRAVHGRLVGAWLDSGVDVVIAHGPAFTESETSALMSSVGRTVPVLRVLLTCPHDVAVQRVARDPERVFSKDAEFLRRTYERFFELAPTIPSCDRTYRSDELDVDAIVSDLIGAVPSATNEA